MARAHKVEHARKDYPEHNIKKGDTYYWWAFRFGGKHFSLIPPKPSQLTQSEFLSTIYAIDEDIQALTTEDDDIQGSIDDIVSQLEELRDECDDKHSNMPDQLQDSEVGELLQERVDNLDDMINELQGIETDEWIEIDDQDAIDDMGDKEDDETQEEFEERIAEHKAEMLQDKRDEILEEIQAISYQGS